MTQQFFLVQVGVQQAAWGPFASVDEAWHYLFGRDSTAEEREVHAASGWHVVEKK